MIQVRDSTSARQDRFFDPVSQNTIWVKSEAQFRNSMHICSFIACHTFKAANIETESLIQLTLLSGSHSQSFLSYGERCQPTSIHVNNTGTCAEHITHSLASFPYLEVPVLETSYIRDDNESQITCSRFPSAQLIKWHNILRNWFQYLGPPVCETSYYVWGDNKSQVTSFTFPYIRLDEQYNILSYHFVCNMVVKGFINIAHIPSEFNPVDILSKHWSHQASTKILLNHSFTFMVMQTTLLLICLNSLNSLNKTSRLFPLSNNLTLNCSQQGTLSYWKDMQWRVIKNAQLNQSSWFYLHSS